MVFYHLGGHRYGRRGRARCGSRGCLVCLCFSHGWFDGLDKCLKGGRLALSFVHGEVGGKAFGQNVF